MIIITPYIEIKIRYHGLKYLLVSQCSLGNVRFITSYADTTR